MMKTKLKFKVHKIYAGIIIVIILYDNIRVLECVNNLLQNLLIKDLVEVIVN